MPEWARALRFSVFVAVPVVLVALALAGWSQCGDPLAIVTDYECMAEGACQQ